MCLKQVPWGKAFPARITDLYVARFGAPPVGKRIFIQTVQQINGWRDRPKKTSARVPAP